MYVAQTINTQTLKEQLIINSCENCLLSITVLDDIATEVHSY